MEKSNSEIVLFLRKLADLLDIAGESGFKSRAYRTASAVLEDIESPIASIARGGPAELQKLPGIGKGIAAQIIEFVATGTSPAWEELVTRTPESMLDVLAVRGIGPKLSAVLHQNFGILDLTDLVRFSEGGGFEAIPGLGDKSVQHLSAAVEKQANSAFRVPADEARSLAGPITGAIKALSNVVSVELAGELRRGKDQVAGVDLVAVVDGPSGGALTEVWASAPDFGRVVVAIESRIELVTRTNMRVIVHVAGTGAAAGTLVRATGSRRHVRELEEIAADLGLAFSGGVLLDVEGNHKRPLKIDSERDFYSRLGLLFIEPDAREGTDEIDAARLHLARKNTST